MAMSGEREEVDRTEAPSARWLAHAHEYGTCPYSRTLAAPCTLLAGVLALRFAGASLVALLESITRNGLQECVRLDRLPSATNLSDRMIGTFYSVMPYLLVPAICGAIVGLVQVGLRFRPERLRPSLRPFVEGINLKRIASGASMKASLLAVLLSGGLVSCVIWSLWRDVPTSFAGENLTGGAAETSGVTLLRCLTKLAFLLVAVGFADYAASWVAHFRQMRLTRAELMAEMRETEGDPLVRRRRRQQRASY